MKQHIYNSKVNKVLLKPRFTETTQLKKDEVINRFIAVKEAKTSKFIIKVAGSHIVLAIPSAEDTFWSPQLQLEVIENKQNVIIKGLFGPKPQLWTFFMFIHFAIALVFFVFAVIFYSRWSLNEDYTFSLIMAIAMPMLWIAFYIFGQIGKKKGYSQMLELNSFMKSIINSL